MSGTRVIKYICVVIEVSVPCQERELSCTYICVVIEVSVSSQERELSSISVLLLRCLYHAMKESYHVHLCCY